MSEIIQKGWLTTRDGEKYAPNTLIESVFTRSGIKYDEQVRQYIANLQNSTTTNLTSINQQLSEHSGDIARLDDEQQALATELDNRLKNLDASDSNTFFIIDNDENVVAYIDAEGIHAIEVEIPDVIKLSDVKPALSAINASIISIQESIAGIEGSITNIDASDRDALFIIDGSSDDPEQCNVIAYIDSNGVHSVNFHALDQPDYVSLVENVSTNTENIGLVDADLQQTKGDLASFKAITNTTLDELNTATKTTLPKAISDAVTKAEDELEAAITQEVSNRDMAIAVAIKNESDARIATDADHNTRISEIEENTQYFDGAARDVLFITDSNENVIAYIDKDGLHAVNIFSGVENEIQYDINDEFAKLAETNIDIYAKLQTEANARALEDSALSAKIASNTTAIDDIAKYFHHQDSNALYIKDSDENVVAYIDANGIHTVNVLIGSTTDENIYDAYQILTQLLNKDNSIDIDIKDINDILDNHEERIGILEAWKISAAQALIDLNQAIQDEAERTDNAIAAEANRTNEAIAAEAKRTDDAIAVEKSAREASDRAHETRLNELEENTQYFNGESRDTLFITDEAGNTIAYINKDGLHIVNVVVGSTEGINATNNTHNVYEVLTQLLTKDESLDLDLVDINKRINDEIKARESAVAAEKTARETMDNNLSIAVNLYTTKPSAPTNGDLYIDTSGNLFIYNEINSTWESFIGLSRQLKEKTQYFDGSADDKFYLVDNSGNVIAYFADDGLHAVNVFVGNDEYGSDRTETTYDVYSKIKQLLQDLEAETSRSTGIDANHSTRIAEIETRLTNVSNVMDFVGVFNSLPAAASYQKGDVCVVGEKEYVHDGSAWKLLGDVSAEMARLDALEKIVGDPATNVTGTHEKRLDDLEANLATEQTTRKDNDDALNNYIVKVEDIVEEMNSNFNWNDPNQNTLYIIDGEERVLAQFDASGLTIIDTVIKDISNNKIKSLKTQASYMLVESSPTLSWL